MAVLFLGALASLSLANNVFDDIYSNCPTGTRVDAVRGLTLERTEDGDLLRISWDAIDTAALTTSLAPYGFLPQLTIIVGNGGFDYPMIVALGENSLVVENVSFTEELTVAVAITHGDLVISDIAESVFTLDMPETQDMVARLRLARDVSELHVRAGPYTHYEIETTLRLWYEIVGHVPQLPHWWQIDYGYGKTGWVNWPNVETQGDLAAVAYVDWNTIAPPETGSPVPSVPGSRSEQGDYRDVSSNRDGRWKVHRLGGRVTATFSCERSPVTYHGRRGDVLFVIPEDFRPLARQEVVVRDARYVGADGRYLNEYTHSFSLSVDPDGAVRYVNNGQLPSNPDTYLKYVANLGWASAATVGNPGAEQVVQQPDGDSRLQVYEGPGTDHLRIGSISVSDDECEILGKETDSHNWWQMDFDGETGWMGTGPLPATGP